MELLNEVAVAKQLGCQIKTLQVWRCRGVGPSFVKVGRLVRYSIADVTEWVNARRVSSTSEIK